MILYRRKIRDLDSTMQTAIMICIMRAAATKTRSDFRADCGMTIRKAVISAKEVRLFRRRMQATRAAM